MPPALSQYEFTNVLLQQSTGIVYAGRFRKTGYLVAIEEIASDLRSTPGFTAHLAEAGKLAASLRHPRAVSVYNLVEEANTLCLITEIISGRPLRQLVPRGAALPPESALAIVDDVLGAVGEAHRVGVIHGDIGPHVVTVGRDGNAKLGGFAVLYAVAVTPGSPAWRRPAYGPDRIPGSGTDGATDIAACAALAHELLTGAAPGEASVEVPGAVAGVLARALGSDPATRFPSAGALRAALTNAAVEDYAPSWRTHSDLPERAGGSIPPPPVTVDLPSARPRPADTGMSPDAPRIPPVSAGTPPGGRAPAPPQAEPVGAPPVPAPEHRRRGRLAALLVVLAIAALIVAVVAVGSSGITNTGPLTVGDDVALAVSPQQGGCNTTFQFVATGSVHGVGTIVYRFEQSDGRATGETPVSITSSEGSFRFTQNWRFQDSNTQHATMTFRILRPGTKSVSQSVDYSCA